jgi:hypothetical protein
MERVGEDAETKRNSGCTMKYCFYIDEVVIGWAELKSCYGGFNPTTEYQPYREVFRECTELGLCSSDARLDEERQLRLNVLVRQILSWNVRIHQEDGIQVAPCVVEINDYSLGLDEDAVEVVLWFNDGLVYEKWFPAQGNN